MAVDPNGAVYVADGTAFVPPGEAGLCGLALDRNVEDIAKVNPALVVRDAKGDVYTVRYEAVNAMLLNEFLKEHRTVQKQQKEIDALRAELKEQRAFIQKVNDKLELNRPAPRAVANNLR